MSAAGGGNEPSVRLIQISKSYGAVAALRDLSLDIASGEFFSLLGPSGSGKTTTLRLIAGFETPARGRLTINGRDVTGIPPHKRDIGMVFQNYALFPHKTVAENVAFGLRMHGVGREEIRQRVDEALRLVALTGYGERRPSQLSGGQQQRVALARAVVIRPQLLLADEPLGALDRKLRQEMQIELRQFQRTVGITMVYVTHDQEEALTMSDRIGVMHEGRLVQVGTPREIYERPRSRFVADFIGTSNFLEGRLASQADGIATVAIGGDVAIQVKVRSDDGRLDTAVTVAVRPEKVRLVRGGKTMVNQLSGRIEAQTFLGDAILSRVKLPFGPELLVRHEDLAGQDEIRVGGPVTIGWQPDDAVLLTV